MLVFLKSILYDVVQIMMRHVTKACFPKTAVASDDLMLPNINNSNANAAATPELISHDLTGPHVTTPELTSDSARTDDKGIAGDRVASAGESLSPANVTGDATEAAETKESTASADLSSAGCVITVGVASE